MSLPYQNGAYNVIWQAPPSPHGLPPPVQPAQVLPRQQSARSRTLATTNDSVVISGQRLCAFPSWAHVAQILALVALLAAVGSVALGASGGRLRSEEGDLHGGSSSDQDFKSEARLAGPLGGRKSLSVNASRPAGQDAALGSDLSLWCFVLMLPWGYEPVLLAAQLEKGTGIFGCDEYAVFSNDSRPLHADAASLETAAAAAIGAGGVPPRDRAERRLTTLPIGGSLSVGLGGKWGTAMNTDIFVRVWAAVILLGRFQHHDWTVKADPDTVFLPSRLRQLAALEPPGAGYLNNCEFGLHGPIEVLSREGVAAYAKDPSACEGIRHDAMDLSHPHDDEDHAFGEDQFLRLCLEKVGVRRVEEFDLLLAEKACGQKPVVCQAGKISYHPFKGIQEWFNCWGLASASSDSWATAIAAAPSPVLAPPGPAPTPSPGVVV